MGWGRVLGTTVATMRLSRFDVLGRALPQTVPVFLFVVVVAAEEARAKTGRVRAQHGAFYENAHPCTSSRVRSDAH